MKEREREREKLKWKTKMKNEAASMTNSKEFFYSELEEKEADSLLIKLGAIDRVISTRANISFAVNSHKSVFLLFHLLFSGTRLHNRMM